MSILGRSCYCQSEDNDTHKLKHQKAKDDGRQNQKIDLAHGSSLILWRVIDLIKLKVFFAFDFGHEGLVVNGR